MKPALFFISIVLSVCLTGMPARAEKQEADNLILKEMAALDKAFKITIDALVLDRLEKIPPAFEEVRRVRQQVEQNILAGKKITLPKNPNLFKVFVKMDDRFHREVEILVEASKKNKVKAVQRQTFRLLLQCVKCHYMFRK